MSIIITLAGFIAMRSLPIAQYPEITPPTVEVSAIYPGANAQVVADTVAAAIEHQGQPAYSMRRWLDPAKMATRNLTASDVVAAIEQQNTQVAAGQLGQPPMDSGQVFQFTMSTMGRLTDVDQFAEMVIKTDAHGRLVRLGDVANIELGAQSYDQSCTLNGRPSVALSIYQLPGSNALETANRVRDKMKDMEGRFPDGLDYAIVYDTTPFIDQSISEVVKTLIHAVILVAD